MGEVPIRMKGWSSRPETPTCSLALSPRGVKLGREAERDLKDVSPMVTSKSWGHKAAKPTHQELSYVRLENAKVLKNTCLRKQNQS